LPSVSSGGRYATNKLTGTVFDGNILLENTLQISRVLSEKLRLNWMAGSIRTMLRMMIGELLFCRKMVGGFCGSGTMMH
jgi:hypothetical protein